MIDSPKCYNVEMQPLHLNEFRNALIFNQVNGKFFEYIPEWRVETMFMEAQGNWKALYESFFRAGQIHI
jgi:hypothetical protein